MSDIPHSECRKCGKPIFWHRSRTNRPYPCDSPSDRRAFHQCSESQPVKVEPVKAEEPKPITPDYFEETLEERVAALEKHVAQLSRTVQEVQNRQPITAEDVGF